MSTDYMSANTLSDHDLTIAIPGEVGNVRPRLIEAVQTIGYKVVGEQPIYAKRGKQGSCADCSLNVLDYPTTLTIAIKQTNDLAVVATFSYEVKSFMHMTKGDRQTLACEAEAIAALATERLVISACRACGTKITDESHFCRRCGAPLVLDLPELEVLRLTRGTRGSYHNIFFGLLALFLAALTIVPVFATQGRIIAPMIWAGLPLGAYALFLIFQGIWQLHRTLNPKTLKNATTSLLPAFNPSVTTALSSAPGNQSVTEGTTDLLIPAGNRQIADPVRRRDADTAEIDTERLM